MLPLTSLEIQVSHKLCTNPKSLIIIKAFIPTPRCSLQSLKGSLELAYLLASLGSTKTFWLYYIQPFLTKTGKETRFDIHLPDFINTANANMNPTDFKHRYGWENLIVVNSLNLWKTFRHKSSFMDGDITIHVRLLLKDPFILMACRSSVSYTHLTLPTN